MKILLLSNMYPSNEYPHYGVFVKNTYEILNDMGYDIKLVVMTKTDSIIKKCWKYFIFYCQIFLNIVFGKFDYIYGHYLSHIALPILVAHKINKNISIILNAHGNDVVPEDKSDERFRYLVVKLLEICKKLIVPSDYFKEIMIKDYNFSSENILVFPSGGINKNIFYERNKEICKKALDFDVNAKYIGYVSRIEKDKGWDCFLKMIKDHHNDNYKYVVVGNGAEEKQFWEKVQEYEINEYIIKYDFMNQENLALLYNSLDVFCFPTYRKSESLGLVGLEAMACGCIVVASDFAGPTTYITNCVNGFLFEKENVKDLINKINEALDMEDEVKRIVKENAKSKALEYDVEKLSGEFKFVFGL